jgi:hypothetical protein
MRTMRTMRTMTVDRQYFDTAEGAHTTNVVRVTVAMITCVDGAYAKSPLPAAAAFAQKLWAARRRQIARAKLCIRKTLRDRFPAQPRA